MTLNTRSNCCHAEWNRPTLCGANKNRLSAHGISHFATIDCDRKQLQGNVLRVWNWSPHPERGSCHPKEDHSQSYMILPRHSWTNAATTLLPSRPCSQANKPRIKRKTAPWRIVILAHKHPNMLNNIAQRSQTMEQSTLQAVHDVILELQNTKNKYQWVAFLRSIFWRQKAVSLKSGLLLRTILIM